MSGRFDPETRDRLLREGWQVAEAPAGLTLAGLRAAGAPFKGTKYFDQQAARTAEAPVAGGEVAYRPGLMPDSLNQTYDRALELLVELERLLPPGVRATAGPAALYVRLW